MAAFMWICAVVAILSVARGLPLDGPLEPSDEFHEQPPMKANATAGLNVTVGSANSTAAPGNATTTSKPSAENATTASPANVTSNATESVPKPTTPSSANSTTGFNVTESPVDVDNATLIPDGEFDNSTSFENSTMGFNVTESPIDTENATVTADFELDNSTNFENSTSGFNITESPIDIDNATLVPDGEFDNTTNFANSTGDGFNVTESILDAENATVTSDIDLENSTFPETTPECNTEPGNVTESTLDVTTIDANSTATTDEEMITLSPIETGNATESGSVQPEVTTDSVPGNSTDLSVSTTETAVNGTTESSNSTTHSHLRWVHATKTTTPAPDDKFTVAKPTIPAGKGVRICTWNVFRFGPKKFDDDSDDFPKKYGKPKIHMMIEQISNCDLLALQEYFDPTLGVLNRLVRALSKNTGSAWNYTVSDRVGRTSQEQYVFLYRTEVAQHQDNEICPDPDDVYSRDPYFAKFKILKKDTCFSDIVLGTIHTEPEKAVEEMNELVKSYDWAEKRFGTKNVMVTGDYNGDCQYVRKSEWPNVKLFTDQRFKWMIKTGTDTASMASECTFDRAVVREDKLFKCFVDVKVLDFVDKYKIKVAEARQLSDHFPVVLNFN
ncbi:mucin-2-like isoform X2 [Paramacrobiotus metropolitanus]|uniref:mucin-2-like isoform X2 n=1 Tax=Paramacrobiotus metropolitanus TaxID=2943436 RepID=UPI00244617CF|nr:mucin-2-like isoform X2 [Paramacrobiotus metropolitanus]